MPCDWLSALQQELKANLGYLFNSEILKRYYRIYELKNIIATHCGWMESDILQYFWQFLLQQSPSTGCQNQELRKDRKFPMAHCVHIYFFRYDVVVSSDVARTRTNGCIFFKLRDPSIDVLPTHYYSHKFVCVAPYNTDTLLLINIPKTMLEKVIKVHF